MRTETYTTKNGATRFRPILESRNDVDEGGFCIACGTEASNVEPDARNYVCESCGQNKVYGLEELVLMGIARVDFT